jgi:predicted enzyme related to lactoylglutathione lyase
MVQRMAMTPRVVTIDCADPRKLAPFWTAAAGYVAEDHWDGAYIVLSPPDGAPGLALGLQKVDEQRLGKNRVHIDWHTEDRPAEVARLAELGATVLAEHQAGDFAWSILADPKGNEFCVAG